MIDLILAVFCASFAAKRGWNPAGGEIVYGALGLSFLGDALKSFIRWCRKAWDEGKL